ncbi:MAG: helix-turn-helix domain-containing protein [Bacteroidia bacterium]|nr:helix-turn-helix domain-containing protein [Bacteroidia bacterium]
MVETTKLKAARKFGPGYFIREQMEMREWTQDDLSEVIGVTVKHLNKILQNKQPLTLDMAKVLGEVFNNSAQYWINIDTSYRLWFSQEKTEAENEAEIKSLIYERMPIKDMLNKGWINTFNNAYELKEQVLKYWDWQELDFAIIDKQYIPCLTRKSEAYNQFNASYAISWYRKALYESFNFNVATYKTHKLEKLYNNLHTYTTSKIGLNLFIKELAEAGVIFFVLPHLQKTCLDGAAFISKQNPVIVYTGRYKRIDNFWFTIAHEIAHVLIHLNEKTTFVLDNLKDGKLNKMEVEANNLASEKLKHNEIVEYLNPYLGYLNAVRVEECARNLHIHPAIVIGKLAHDKKISYNNQGLYNENVLEIIQKQYQILG